MEGIMNSAGETAATVAYRAKTAGDHLSGYAKQHPIRIAVTIGAGALTWFMLRGRNRAGAWGGASDTSWEEAEEMASEGGPSIPSRVGEGARRASASVRSAARTTTTSVDEWVRENPLAAGGIALAVGAAIGLSMPATAIENRTMGRA